MVGLDEQQQQREIDGVTYRVFPLPFGKGKRVAQRLLRVMAPIFAAAGVARSQLEQGANVLASIPAALNEADLDFLEDTFADASHFLEPATGNWIGLGNKTTRDLHFAARYDRFLAWLVFSLEVNFSSLFRGGVVRQAIGTVRELIAPATSGSK